MACGQNLKNRGLEMKLRGRFVLSCTAFVLAGVSGAAFAASGSLTAASRIVQPIDESKLVSLAGGTPRAATAKNDRGAVPDSFRLDHMFLQLTRTAQQEQALERQIQEMQDPHSASYHHWLTAEELGENFGPSRADIGRVVDWLSSHGLQVNTVHKNGLTIDVSGTAGELRDAFHTEIHNYSVNGTHHIANASVAKIPAALAPVIGGFASLNDFMPKPLLKPHGNFSFPCTGCPGGFNNAEQYDEAPADFATIYNITPLYTAATPITGKGITVVVLEPTDVLGKDVATFRSAFGLSAYSGTFRQIHPGTGCADPGTNGGEGEAALDAEWAGAAAPDANVELASCADTATSFGAFMAAQNLLDTAAPPHVMSLSYGECEAENGAGTANEGNAFVTELWEQAAAEGVSVFVSAGDGAAAVCDDFDTATYAVDGIAVSGLASTPYNVATGGTDFMDSYDGTNSTYWSMTNSATGKSAKSYIPEMPWDDSCAGSILYSYEGYTNGVAFCNSSDGAGFLDIVGGSGGPSFVHSKPYWQAGTYGMPNDGKRDLPDVSLFASNGFWGHAIMFCMSDATEGGTPCDYKTPVDAFYNSAGGTSFTAPQYAGIQALIDQKAGGRQGNPAPNFYALAKAEYGSAGSPNTGNVAACNSSEGNQVGPTCIFHDVTQGSNDVPCYGTVDCFVPNPEGYGVLSKSDTGLEPAFSAHSGWDFTTGLGSVNVTNLVNAWP
jgi:subtilase family serine protease